MNWHSPYHWAAMRFFFQPFLVAAGLAAAEMPRDAVPVDAAELPADFRLHFEFESSGGGVVRLGDHVTVTVGDAAGHDVAVEHPLKGSPLLRVWSGGKLVRGPEEVPALRLAGASDFPKAALDLGEDFTAMVKFESTGEGVLFSKCAPIGKWSPDAKALFIRGGRLVYDIGWLGSMTGGSKVSDGTPHVAVVSAREGMVRLWLDGKVVAERKEFSRPDVPGHVFKLGRAADDFGGELANGNVTQALVWKRALPDSELALLLKDNSAGASTPDFTHARSRGGTRPRIEPAAGVSLKTAWVQPLQQADFGELVGGWNEETMKEGAQIYNTLCVVCHGTKDQLGSLPTALRFAEGPFKNGSDPWSMHLTLTKGFGQMVPQPQYTTAQKFAVIHYIRETFLRGHNPSQYNALTPAYIASLPKGLALAEAEKEDRSPPPYERMDLGSALMWTYQIAPGNIAQKGIAIRLDEGPGGVSRGRAWMIYDHDTMRVAAATSGAFIDWKGIAFDGSHGTHTTLAGERHFVNPPAPGWASPDGTWDDTRLLGRDGKRYGPLPKAWAVFEGLYRHGSHVVLTSKIGGVRVLESPSWIDYGASPVFIRTLNIAASSRPLLLRVAPHTINVTLVGEGQLRQEAGFWTAELKGGSKARLFISRADPASIEVLSRTVTTPLDLDRFTHGGPVQWPQEVETISEAGAADGAFVADTFPLPVDNPWQSWMRPGGFDFTPDGTAAVVAMWNGDVWRVEGITLPAPSTLRWRRIASGLFQPLGVKYRGQELFIMCRDQLALLKDLNVDGEIDFIECFNNDHQVTEHFHEFAMGLQTDSAGNFYYAKSGRHALDSVVPHHGTLLRISADGARTSILATGFRAANGVCLNDDGTFFITDQEGFWTPKNRINRVKPDGFYGNMFGFTSVTNTADSSMEPPMVWITNAKDRSPAELLWVPRGVWGSLGGALLNLSYGTGRIFVVPHELSDGVWQGAVCELPMPAFETGIMRGRFGADRALYTCGMFAWAGNATAPGGFHRVRRGGRAAHIPLAVQAKKAQLRITFSEPLDLSSVKAGAFALKVWSLRRSANYGSKHLNERPLEITMARLAEDQRVVTLTIPDLAPTDSYELVAKVRGADGAPIERSLHGTILRLPSR